MQALPDCEQSVRGLVVGLGQSRLDSTFRKSLTLLEGASRSPRSATAKASILEPMHDA